MAIDDNTVYGLTGAQVKELPEKIEAMRGLAKVLTTADYNYPTTGTKTAVALWLLEPGMYYAPNGVTVRTYVSGSHSSGATYVVGHGQGMVYILQMKGSSVSGAKYYVVDNTGTAYVLNQQAFVGNMTDNLTSSTTEAALSANQGRVLKNLIDGLAISGAGAPTTATVGTVGKLYEDTTNGKLYICTAIVPGTAPDPDTYTWVEVGAGGGGGITELTTADYNWNNTAQDTTTEPLNTIALWLLPPGVYKISGTAYVRINPATNRYSSSGKEVFTVAGLTTSDTEYSKSILCQSYDSSAFKYTLKMYNAYRNGSSTSNTDGMDIITTYNIAQSTGTSTTSVMSQNAVTGMVYDSPSQGALFKVRLGQNAKGTVALSTSYVAVGTHANAAGSNSVAIGSGNSSANGPTASGAQSLAIMRGANASADGAIALGAWSTASSVGEMNIGSSDTSYGYNSSNYRLLTGLYDPQSAHDAATKGYVDAANSYSTTEVATGGTWTDGSTIYKRTFTGTLSSQETSIDANAVPSGATLVKAEGVLNYSTFQHAMPFYSGSTDFARIYLQGTNLIVNSGSAYYSNSATVKITLYYIKSV